MQIGWKVQVERPKFAFSRLASLQTESPANSHAAGELGVLVALWCGRESIQVGNRETLGRFTFGFTVGELEVSVKNGRLSPHSRFKQEFYREKIDQNEKDTSTKEGKAGAFFGLDFTKLFSGAKFNIEAGGNISKGSVVLEEKKGEYYRVYWRIADSGHKRWKCFGDGLNTNNVLENKILGDDILCFVIPEEEKDEVQIVVKYYSDELSPNLGDERGQAAAA